jgi:hypothetical protein
MIQQSHIVGGVYTHPENCAHSVLILQIFVDCPITSGTIVNLTFPGTPFATNLVGTIATIPEPASLAVFCVGLAGIASCAAASARLFLPLERSAKRARRTAHRRGPFHFPRAPTPDDCRRDHLAANRAAQVIDGIVGWHANRVKLKCAAFAGA